MKLEINHWRQSIATIYTWGVHSTTWRPERDIAFLRDDSIEQIVTYLLSCEQTGQSQAFEAQVNAIKELASHGCQRKAAEVARGLVKVKPALLQSLQRRFTDYWYYYFFVHPIHLIPESPPNDCSVMRMM